MAIIARQAPEADEEQQRITRPEQLPAGLCEEVGDRIAACVADWSYRRQYEGTLGEVSIARVQGESMQLCDPKLGLALEHDLNLQTGTDLPGRCIAELARHLRQHPMEGDYGALRLDPEGNLVVDVKEHIPLKSLRR